LNNFLFNGKKIERAGENIKSANHGNGSFVSSFDIFSREGQQLNHVTF
jgi:hypothetical protein